MRRVLLVEDQVPFVVQGIIEALGEFTVEYVKTGDAAVGRFLKESYDLVLLDLRLPGLPGLMVLDGLRRIDKELPVVVVSAFGDKRTREQALKLGASDYFVKPPDYRRLHRRMVELCARREIRLARGRGAPWASESYHLANIRALLTQGFEEQQLRALIFDEFRAVYEQLAEGSGKDVLVQRLLAYAEETIKLEQLLDLAQAANPARYALHQPYRK